MSEKKFLEKLSEAGIEFMVHLHDGCYNLNPTEVLEYVENPELFEAKIYEITLEQLQSWKEHRENPHCHALTKQRKPCNGYVDPYCSLEEFISQKCVVFCKVHQHLGINS